MKPRSKLRTFCRWMLTILTVVLVVVWIGSGWYSLNVICGWTVIVGTVMGDYPFGPHITVEQGTFRIFAPEGYAGLRHINDIMSQFDRLREFDMWLWTWRWDGRFKPRLATFPLWVPALLVAIPAALMWRTEIIARHRKPGMCKKCGYDITGLVGKEACPECGAVFEVVKSQASAS